MSDFYFLFIFFVTFLGLLQAKPSMRRRLDFYSSTDVDTLIDKINEYREDTAAGDTGSQPKAKDMVKTAWDTALEEVADLWVRQCTTGTNPYATDDLDYVIDNGAPSAVPKGSTLGESSYIDDSIPGPAPVTLGLDGLAEWYGQHSFYTFSTNTCSSPCSDYTQLVKDELIAAGCAFTTCFGGGPPYDKFVCNYYEHDDGSTPYTEAPTPSDICSDCPTSHPSCPSSLCVAPTPPTPPPTNPTPAPTPCTSTCLRLFDLQFDLKFTGNRRLAKKVNKRKKGKKGKGKNKKKKVLNQLMIAAVSLFDSHCSDYNFNLIPGLKKKKDLTFGMNLTVFGGACATAIQNYASSPQFAIDFTKKAKEVYTNIYCHYSECCKVGKQKAYKQRGAATTFFVNYKIHILVAAISLAVLFLGFVGRYCLQKGKKMELSGKVKQMVQPVQPIVTLEN